MAELGITLYPEKSEFQDMMQYLKLCRKYHFSYLYLNTLSSPWLKSRKEAMEFYGPVSEAAHKLGYKIVYDIAPRIFIQWQMMPDDLSVFHDLHADTVRIDQPFSGQNEAMMTCNPYGIRVELQMDNDVHYIDTVMDYCPQKRKLSGSHNFYPHPYTGLSVKKYEHCSERFIRYGLPVTTYVSSQSPNAFCQWPDTTGGPTLEEHRHLPLYLQIKDYIAMQNADRIILCNGYAEEDELKKASALNYDVLTFCCTIEETTGIIERKIILEELHFYRGDASDWCIRSTQSRVKYKGNSFPLHNPKPILEKGDIVIESSAYGMYAGELQIVLQDMPNSGKSNVVGRICQEELFLLSRIRPWQKFLFSER